MKYFYKSTIFLFIFATLLSAKNLTQLQSFDPWNYELLDVEIDGHYMIIPAGLGGAVLFDITDPANPAQLSRMNMQSCLYNRSYNWDITGSIAIGTARECGFGVYDISDPQHPNFAGILNPDEIIRMDRYSSAEISLEDVEIVGSTAIFSAHSDGVILYDVSSPSAPVFVGMLPTINAWSLAVNKNTVYVADGEGGLSIVDITDKSAPTLLARHETAGSARDIRYHRGKVFVAVGASGIDVFDVSDRNNPVFLHNHITNGFASRVAVKNDLVSVSAWVDLEVFRWNSSELELVGYKNTGGRVMAVGSPQDNIIYSAEWQTFRVFEFAPISGADIDVNPMALNFGRIELGESDTLSLTMENNGGMPLNISYVGVNNPDFAISPQVTNIDPDQQEQVNVIHTAQGNNGGGVLEILSNDSDESTVKVRITEDRKNTVDIGLPAPDFTLPVVANAGRRTMRLSELRDQVVVIAFFASW